MHKAKAYLLKYKTLKERAKRLDEQLQTLYSRYALPASPELSDMPKARNTEHDLSDAFASIEDVREELIKAYCKCAGMEGDIIRRIERMEDSREQLVLEYAYLDGMSWEQIADAMCLSYSRATHLHGDALNHFPLPTDES